MKSKHKKHNKKYLNIDGRKISYLEEGHGENILLMPGLGCDCTLWRFVMPILAKHYHAVSISLPLYGTTNSFHQKYDFNTYPEFLEKVIKYFGWRDGFYLCCHSLGGIVAIKYSISHPGKVRKMVLASAPLSDHQIPIPLLYKIGVELALRSKKSKEIIDWIAGKPEILDHLAQIIFPNRHTHNPRGNSIDFLKTVPIVAAASCYNDLFNMSFAKDVANVRIPTLFVYGTKDQALLKFGGTRLYPSVRSAKIIPLDCYHFIPVDAPEQIAQIAIDFFQNKSHKLAAHSPTSKLNFS